MRAYTGIVGQRFIHISKKLGATLEHGLVEMGAESEGDEPTELDELCEKALMLELIDEVELDCVTDAIAANGRQCARLPATLRR